VTESLSEVSEILLSNHKRVGFATFAILATMFIAMRAQVPAPVTSGTRHAFAQKLSLGGVPVFAQVTPTLYRGAQPTDEGFRNLAEMGVKIIVDQRGSRKSEREQVTKLGMQYVAIPWHCPLPEDTVFARFLTLLHSNPGTKVFVHCLSGQDRTGMQIAAYRMAEQGWSAQEAKQEMEAFGFSRTHRWRCPGLSSYEERFPKRFKESPAFKDLRASANSSKQ
jgi:tyrosine-protein phosphatase SIW14